MIFPNGIRWIFPSVHKYRNTDTNTSTNTHIQLVMKYQKDPAMSAISWPRVNYAYLRASNARASFVKVPEKIWGKNAHLERARVMGK